MMAPLPRDAPIAGEITPAAGKGEVASTSPKMPTPGYEIDYTYFIIGGASFGVGLLIVIGFLVVYLMLRRRVASQSAAAGRVEAEKRIKASTPAMEKYACQAIPHVLFLQMTLGVHPSMTKSADLEATTKRLGDMKRSEVKEYLQKIRYKRHADKKLSGEVRRVLDEEFVFNIETRYPQCEIIECTQTPVIGQFVKEKDHWCMHANTLPDFYGNDFIISQAPTKEMYQMHWEAVWQRKVGVIVWLGPMRGACCGHLIDPYLGTSGGLEELHGRFEVKTIAVHRFKYSYHVFKILVKNRYVFNEVDPHGQENRQLYVVHIESWPTSRRSSDPKKVSLMVEFVRSLSMDRMSNRLSGVWTHCSTGVSQSATFYAVYVNRQMQYHYSVINVQATLQMVARVRYKCFQSSNAFDQVRIVHNTLLEFTKSYPHIQAPLAGSRGQYAAAQEQIRLITQMLTAREMARAAGKKPGKGMALPTASYFAKTTTTTKSKMAPSIKQPPTTKQPPTSKSPHVHSKSRTQSRTTRK